MASITSWIRLQPFSRDAEMKTTLQARIYDPLWLLTRQWQLGEFQGEDNGSPILAQWHAEAAPLTRYHLGATTNANNAVHAARYDRSIPLEALVERESIRPLAPVGPPEKIRLAAEAGQHFLRILEARLLNDYRDAFVRLYAFPALNAEQRSLLDSNSLNFYDLMTLRVPDGRQLDAAFRLTAADGISIDADLGIAPADLNKVKDAAQFWLQWYETLFSEPEVANQPWDSERMEYSFSVAGRLAQGECTLTADEYFDGHLDWYAFDANPALAMVEASTDEAPKEIEFTTIPAPVSFRGMPAARFWEFEDAQVDFGAVDAGPTDLGRMLLVEFALNYGNDWFVIPVELPVGSLYRTNSLVITDTFGQRTLIKATSESGEAHSKWRMFQQSFLRRSDQSGSERNLFFLPPSLLKSLESQPIEEVLFLRDEMANMAWGVERIVESATEYPLNRTSQIRQQVEPPTDQAGDEILRYRLASEVPDNWVPFLPVKSSEGLRLQRGRVYQRGGNGQSQFVEARGRILNPGLINPSLRIFEEEIPREGIRVTRHYQFTRWHDGSTHLWVGRRKKVGTGEGSSGLRFDILERR